MKKAIMKKWVSLLRSGEIKQGRYALETADVSMSCLGVLCNLALVEGVCEVDTVEKSPHLFFDDMCITLPESIQKWAGMKTSDGEIPTRVPHESELPLSKLSLLVLNDDYQLSFRDIADLIEKHWREL